MKGEARRKSLANDADEITYQLVGMPKLEAKSKERNPSESRKGIVDATIQLILKQGFAATTVEQICAEAGLTKGGFFHHFASKEAVGRAAIQAWGDFGTALYAEAWKNPKLDPLKQLHRMLDIMSGFTQEPDKVCTCVVGMLAQELAQSHPALREECARQLEIWTENVAKILSNAKSRHKPKRRFDPHEVAWFLNSLWQGSMLVAKARQAPEMTRANLRLARACVDDLFERP